ncbi:MAG: arylsulfatase [Verrucomicrobiales bacterium]|nr:arylsulfatase [Verrucomicrobiales bacterium]
MTKSIHLLLFAFIISAAQASSAADQAPNIIVILADDLGYGDLHRDGGLPPTPHCDRLATEGMRFTDAHTTSSVCTPTRYGILTGRYNWRSPLKKSVLFGLDTPLIPTSRLTLPAYLQQQNYHTAIVGKWHLGLGWQKLPNGETRKASSGDTEGKGWDIDYSKKVSGGPTALGFDQSYIIPASLDMFPYVYLKNDKPTQEATLTKAFSRPGPAGKDFDAINCLKDFARASRAYIKTRAAEKDKPFFLYLPLTSPHTPILPSKAWQGKSSIGAYGDFLMETDWVVGEVLAELDQQKLSQNTMVIFVTDNGCSPAAKIPDLVAQGHKPNGDLRGHKADIYEGGHRIPFIVRWPAKVKAGSTANQTICTSDIFATAADIHGKLDSIPASAAEDSFSFLSILNGKNPPKEIRPFTIHHSINGSFAIRKGKWKLALCPGSGGWSQPKPKQALKDMSLPNVQLFDLEADLAEQHNLQAKHPDVVQELVKELATAINAGRTTSGPQQSNDGYPNTFSQRVLKEFPILAEKK